MFDQNESAFFPNGMQTQFKEIFRNEKLFTQTSKRKATSWVKIFKIKKNNENIF